MDEFEFGQNSTADFGVSCPRASEKMSYNLVSTLAPSFFNQIFFILGCMEDNHNISDNRFIIRHNGENLVSPLEPSFLIGSFFIFAGNEDNHKSLDKLNFGGVYITDFGVSCP